MICIPGYIQLVIVEFIYFILEYLAINGSIDVYMLIIENFVRKNRGYSDDNFRKKKKKKEILTQKGTLKLTYLNQIQLGRERGKPGPDQAILKLRGGGLCKIYGGTFILKKKSYLAENGGEPCAP